MKKYALYNSSSCNNRGGELAQGLQEIFPEDEIVYQDVLEIGDYPAFMAGVEEGAAIVVCGGDGTLNNFVNRTQGTREGKEIYFFPCGSGNDFMRDVAKEGEKIVRIDALLKDLPTVYVKGESYQFVNGVGYGIDGYCCEMGDKLRLEKPGKEINYAGIAIKGLLFHYKPSKATVIVDGGEPQTFENVWLAPTMYGRYYGGGMWPCPEQRRDGEEKKVSVMVFHGKCKLQMLMLFPGIFKGTHVKNKKHISVFAGNEITVKYDEPRPLQVDGETILDVTEYTVKY